MRQRVFVAWLPAVLFIRRHFTERARVSIRLEHGIIAEAELAARWPYQITVYLTTEILSLAIGEAQAEHRNEIRPALFGLGHSLFLQKIFDLLHRKTEIARTVGHRSPISRVDARCALKRLDAQAGII